MSDRVFKLLRWYSLAVGVLMTGPLVVVILASFNRGIVTWVPPRRWGFEWYDKAVHNELLTGAFRFSLVNALVVAVVATVVGGSVGLAIARYRFAGRDVIHAVVMAPLLIPHIVLALGILKLFSEVGLNTSPQGLVAGHIVSVLPFVVRLTLSGAGAIDPRLEKAAHGLGASSLRTLWTVTLPQMAPALASASVLAFLVSFDESVISVFTATPGNVTLPATLLNYYHDRSDPLIAAASAIVIVLSIVVVVILDRAFGLLKLLGGNSAATRTV